MPDDLIDLESILENAENATPQELQALLPAAKNPGAHAPATGNLSSDEIIAKQVNEATPAAQTTETQTLSSESEIETETQTEQEVEVPQISAKDALFEQLRVQFPNESLVNLAARAEAAFSSEPAPVQEGNEGDVLAEIQSDYDAMLEAAREADEHVQSLMNPEDGTLVEYTSEIRDAERAAMRANLAAEASFEKLAFEANKAVEDEYPELNDPKSPAFLAVSAAVDVNPSIRESSPVALANLARHIASSIRQAAPAPVAAAKPLPSPTRVPAPAGPKPPVASLSSSVQASHASAATPAPGAQQNNNDVVSKIRNLKSLDDLESAFFGKGLSTIVLS